ncbi:MAG: carbohydrate ABC transporter permease, partial [Vallitalea sp.]|nr:carbohydrate ABC transporter permease [Vallitalea sp.]
NFKMATVMISVVPILCVYPFLQKYFTKGVMLGSVKG